MKSRDPHLDAVKGFLVFVMVLYHAMNYFSNASPELYGYLRFVNGAFVFISGYVVSVFYGASIDRDASSVSRRLAVRGVKLLLIFTALNVAISAVGLTSYKSVQFGLERFLGDLPSVYLSGNSESMAFRILLPIAYVLLLSPLFLRARRFIGVLAVGVVLAAIIYWLRGPDWPNLYFVLVGAAGLILGCFSAYSDLYRVHNRMVLLVSFISLAAVMNYMSGTAATYAVGLFLLLKLVYDWAAGMDPASRVGTILVLVGKHSLVSYITQIAFLHFLRRILSSEGPLQEFELLVSIVLTGALMVVLSGAIARMRLRFGVFDRWYRLVLP